MNISAHDIKIFTTVVAIGNITRGASKLGITQPAVTRALQRLEHELGAELLIRTRKGVITTRAGKELLVRSKTLLSNFEDLTKVVKNQKVELSGGYTIGVHSDLAGHTLPKFVNHLLGKYPKLELNFIHDLSREITKQVIDLKIDFGIVVNPIQHLDLTIVKLYQDQVGFFLDKRHKLDRIIKQENVPIFCNPDLTQTIKLLRQIKRQKLFPNARLTYTTSLQLIADLTATSIGVGILPETTALLHYSDKLQIINSMPTHRDDICLVYRKDMLRGTAGDIIKSLIIESVKEG